MDTRPRRSAHFSWKPELHDAFLAAIDACGGMFKCTPSEVSFGGIFYLQNFETNRTSSLTLLLPFPQIMYEMIKQGTVVPGLESKQIKSVSRLNA